MKGAFGVHPTREAVACALTQWGNVYTRWKYVYTHWSQSESEDIVWPWFSCFQKCSWLSWFAQYLGKAFSINYRSTAIPWEPLMWQKALCWAIGWVSKVTHPQFFFHGQLGVASFECINSWSWHQKFVGVLILKAQCMLCFRFHGKKNLPLYSVVFMHWKRPRSREGGWASQMEFSWMSHPCCVVQHRCNGVKREMFDPAARRSSQQCGYFPALVSHWTMGHGQVTAGVLWARTNFRLLRWNKVALEPCFSLIRGSFMPRQNTAKQTMCTQVGDAHCMRCWAIFTHAFSFDQATDSDGSLGVFGLCSSWG